MHLISSLFLLFAKVQQILLPQLIDRESILLLKWQPSFTNDLHGLLALFDLDIF